LRMVHSLRMTRVLREACKQMMKEAKNSLADAWVEFSRPYLDKGMTRSIMGGRYQVDMTEDGILGQGTFCVCRRGWDVVNHKEVAVKAYKSARDRYADEARFTKFKRSIDVLKRLENPFEQPADPTLWTPELANARPDHLFLSLLDYSKDAQGVPDYDPTDGELYVVTELGQCSLKDYLAQRRVQVESNQSAPPSKDTVRMLTQAIITVVAGLHAKGLVHLDLKPENLMLFDGRLKLIDVDGCVEIGTSLSVTDPSISFSPCYCAPEWASFLMQHGDETCLAVTPGLDTWSVGCTLCELVTLKPILKPAYQEFARTDRRNVMSIFMKWLISLEEAPVPRVLEEFDSELDQLISECFLVCEQSERRTCAESLDSPCLQPDRIRRTNTCPLRAQETNPSIVDDPQGNSGDKVESTTQRTGTNSGDGVDIAALSGTDFVG